MSDQAIGLDIFGTNNSFTVAFDGARTPGNDVIFEESSYYNNILYLLSPLPSGYTNNSLGPNNRIVLAGAMGFKILTPAFPASGSQMTNDTPYRIQATI